MKIKFDKFNRDIGSKITNGDNDDIVRINILGTIIKDTIEITMAQIWHTIWPIIADKIRNDIEWHLKEKYENKIH